MNTQAQDRLLGSRSWVFKIAVLIGMVAVLAAVPPFLLVPMANRFGIGQADHMFLNIIWWALSTLMLGWAWYRLFKRQNSN